MKFGLYGLHRGSSAEPAALAARARLAEEAGFESLWVGDHIALPDEFGASQPRLEAVVALTYLAAVTREVRLGFGVIVLPQRQPVLLAKQVASIDTLCRGRLILGVGAGYIEPELQALGVPLAERGARLDEYLDAMRALWATQSFHGRYVSFDGVSQHPRPVQQPHPPIVVGGHSPAALRRAVRVGSGWYGAYLGVDEAADVLAKLREAVNRHERPTELGELEITVTPPEPPDLATARRYAELGVHRLAIQPSTAEGDEIEQLITTVGETLVGHA
jgi:probable F420-dependent oxidoreductase